MNTRGRAIARRKGFVPMVVASVATLVLGGISTARAAEPDPVDDALSNLEFSTDGIAWSDTPQSSIGSWGCDDPDASAAPGVDPCRMSPGDEISRTYFVKNVATDGTAGRYSSGVGDYEVTDHGTFDVTSTITTTSGLPLGAGEAHLRGGATGETPTPVNTQLAIVDLVPGRIIKVVDVVSVPESAGNDAQSQESSPHMWVDFSLGGVADSDGDGLSDAEEETHQTDPHKVDTDGDGVPDGVEVWTGSEPTSAASPAALAHGTVGKAYGPLQVLPSVPAGDTLTGVDGLPPGMTLSASGQLVGTPTAAGTYTISFDYTHAGAPVQHVERTIVVDPASSTGGSGSLGGIADWLRSIGLGWLAGFFDSGSLGGGSTGSSGTDGSNSGSGSCAPGESTGQGSLGTGSLDSASLGLGSANSEAADPACQTGSLGSIGLGGPALLIIPIVAGIIALGVAAYDAYINHRPPFDYSGPAPRTNAAAFETPFGSVAAPALSGAPSATWIAENSEVRAVAEERPLEDYALWGATGLAGLAVVVLLVGIIRRRD